jgi:hypothetical protein
MSFADHIARLLVLAKANEFGVPQVVVAGPLEELELADEPRLQPLAFRHLRFRQALAQRPLLASGRFANGHSLISRPLNFLNSCARVTGVKPLRVLAT